jgi:hypothetical protein
MKITINGHEFTAAMEKNAAAAALEAMVEKGPITLDMKDFASQEKAAQLPAFFPREDTNVNAEPGDLVLYDGRTLVLIYRTTRWNYTKLGSIKKIKPDKLFDLLGYGSASVTLAAEGKEEKK